MGYIKDLYRSTMDIADPIASSYPLMGAPHNMLTIVALYVIVCLQGPKWMEGAKPYKLKKTIVCYNYFMSLLNLYIFVNFAGGLIRKGYSVKCEHLETFRNTPDENMWLDIGYLFVVSKVIEFLDTIFFILSNKMSHVTFLHCYHHAVMFFFCWIGFKFLPGGANVIYGLINSFVHVVMYVYYGTAAIGPHMRKYLWWKKYLTKMQMSQFVLFLGQGVINYIYGCPIPAIFNYCVNFFTFTILLLFANFYIQAYTTKRRTAQPSAISNGKESPVSNGKKSPISNGKKSPVSNGKKSPVSNGKKSPVSNGKKSPVSNGKKEH